MTQVTKHMGNMAGIYNRKPRALHSNTQQTLPTQRPITQNFLSPNPLHFRHLKTSSSNTQFLFIRTSAPAAVGNLKDQGIVCATGGPGAAGQGARIARRRRRLSAPIWGITSRLKLFKYRISLPVKLPLGVTTGSPAEVTNNRSTSQSITGRAQSGLIPEGAVVK